MTTATYARASNNATRGNRINSYLVGKVLIGGYSGVNANNVFIGSAALGISPYSVSGTYPSDLIVGTAVDSGGNGWVLKSRRELIEITGQPPTVVNTYALASTSVFFIDVCCIGTQTYVLGTDGNIYTPSGGALVAVSTSGTPGFTGHLQFLATDGTVLYVVGSQGYMNTLTFSNATTAAWGTAALTAAHPSTVLYDGTHLNVAGTSEVNLNTGAAVSTQIAATVDQFLVVEKASSAIEVFTQSPTATGNISSTQTLTLTSATSPDELLIYSNSGVVTDATNGIIDILLDSSGTWSESGTTFSIAGAQYLGLVPTTNAQVLVSSPSGNTISVLTDTGGTWTLDPTTVAVTGPGVLAVYDTTHAAVADTAGVSFLTYNTAWGVGGSVGLPAQPSRMGYLTADGAVLGAVYDSGGTRYLAAIDTASYTVLDTYTIGATAGFTFLPFMEAFGFDQTRGVILADPIYTNGTYSQAVADGTGRYFFLDTANGYYYIYKRLNPGSYAPVNHCVVWANSASATLSNSYGDRITAGCEYVAGSVYWLTQNNNLYDFTGTTENTSSAIPPDTGQPASVPMGLSDAFFDGNFIQAASSIYGGLTTITP